MSTDLHPILPELTKYWLQFICSDEIKLVNIRYQSVLFIVTQQLRSRKRNAAHQEPIKT